MTDTKEQTGGFRERPGDRENHKEQVNPAAMQLNNTLEQKISEQRRAEQINRTLFRISNAVSTTKDLGELYTSIHRILGEIIDLTNFYIAIYSRTEKRVSFPYFIDQFDTGSVYVDQINRENSLTGEVIINRKPVFLNAAELQERAVQNRIVGTVPKVWLGVPLLVEGDVVGIMAAQCYEKPHRFDLLDLDILVSVSDQVALAIERKKNEQALVESEKKYRNIIESLEDGYFEFDIGGKLILVNQAMCKMLGYDQDQLLGMNTSRLLTEDSTTKVQHSFSSVPGSEKRGENLELQFRRRNGTIVFAETVLSVICCEDGSLCGYRGIARDITERKEAERSRKILEERLQQSHRLESLGTLAGGIAHDFNNLLMNIQGRTELMRSDLPKEHPHYLQLLHIEKSVENAARLTTRLLGFARGGKYQVQPVDLNLLIEKSIQMFGRTKKDIVIDLDLQEGLSLVEVDSNQVEQVLVNLLVNAGQAMTAGGSITIATTMIQVDENDARFYDISPGRYVRLTLSDDGTGMDEETMGKIFDPFFTTKPIGSGTGLGLAMVYGIVRNHSGAIAVASKLNMGTTFTILLPASGKTLNVATATKNDVSSPVAKGSETVLLVDDEPMIVEVGQQMLAALGYEVLTASSGEEAIALYVSNKDLIDLLIIDMLMPRMSGGELFDTLKKHDPAVKVLLASGYSIEGEARAILQRGCKGFIQKPFTIAELSTKLRQILA
jgi:two-component system, cell cycle sensor histidine kinase and response regulator CckA